MSAALIDIAGLSVGFRDRSGAMRPVLRDIDLSVAPGESLGLVGESGSGKSTLALAAMGYLKRGLRVIRGSARFHGLDMFALDRPALDTVRGGRLALIPQNAGQSLTPTLRIGTQLEEALRLHSRLPREAHAARVVALLTQVRLPSPAAIALRYPHELSGGQQQRVAIAMALAGEPEALLLDEPTTGLDVTTQAHVLALLRDLRAQTGMAMVYVSHDLGAVAQVCDRVAVMYAGEIVLDGTAAQVLRAPAHPYARGLLAAIPRLAERRLPVALEGRPPAPGGAGAGCAFAPRCALAEESCRRARPPLQDLPGGLRVRCPLHARAGTLPMAPQRVPGLRTLEGPTALAIAGLSISYARPGLLDQLRGRPARSTATVDRIDLRVATGETIGLVGESGSGKSTLLKAIAGLLAPAGGSICLSDGSPLPAIVERRRPEHLRRVQLIFQNPDESLNPRHSIADILAQPLGLYLGLRGEALRGRSVALLEQVRLGAHYLDRLPGQLSGGEKQRVAIARAFAAEPDIVLCDEVTSALDVSVQAAVLGLLDRLRRERATTYVFVSHDLTVVRALADRVAVLYQGRLCEIGPAEAVYAAPSHPYTAALLAAVLEPDPDSAPVLMAADVTESAPPPAGCPFQRRCPVRLGPVCDREAPPWQVDAAGHAIACHIPRERLSPAPSLA